MIPRWKLLHKMRDTSRFIYVVIFSAAISACEKGGLWEQGLTRPHKMRCTSMTTIVISFNAAISASEKGGLWELAWKLPQDIYTLN